jgi:phosphatidylethanolamine-binding protein (PEBP) family uncharacterized protein
MTTSRPPGRPVRTAAAFMVAAALAAACGDEGGERLDSGDLPTTAARLPVTSPAFTEGSRLPARYTCDAAGDEPVVRAGTVPTSTSELVLVMSDPDAPGGDFVHVTRYDLPKRGDGDVSTGGRTGTNSAGGTGWTPPCPPNGDAPHRYVWTVYALREPSGLPPGASPADVLAALEAHGIIARGTITARYGR